MTRAVANANLPDPKKDLGDFFIVWKFLTNAMPWNKKKAYVMQNIIFFDSLNKGIKYYINCLEKV